MDTKSRYGNGNEVTGMRGKENYNIIPSTLFPHYWWLGCLVVRKLDLQLNGREFDSQPPRLVLAWVTVFERAKNLSILPSIPGQLSLLPSAGPETSTGQSAAKLCGCGK